MINTVADSFYMSQNSSLENIISEISSQIEPIFWQSHQPANSFSMEHIPLGWSWSNLKIAASVSL